MNGSVRGAQEFLDQLVDPGSYHSWDIPPDHGGITNDYRGQLARARERSGAEEAVVTGQAAIAGHAVAVVVSDFTFLGGSIGVATARRIVAAVKRATADRLPLLAAPASGGTRMQEGTAAFVEMIAITRAVEAHKAAGLPYLVYLRHPTTGGVMASWASRGHLHLAEPGALLGFLGPKVFQALHGQAFPPGVQIAENLHRHGLVDDVVALLDLPDVLARVLSLLTPSSPTINDSGATDKAVAATSAVPASPVHPRLIPDDLDGWACVQLTRHPDRPGVRDLLHQAGRDTVWLSGRDPDGQDPLVIALVDLAGQRCVLIGQDRVSAAVGAPLGATALRRARRALHLADQLDLPVVTVIDTPGAELSAAAEEDGLAQEIAGCIADLAALRVPTVAVLLGQGTGGGALALFAANRVVAAEYAWLAPLPPEGASAITSGTTAHAAQQARAQHIRARDLFAAGIVHAIVAEHHGAQADPRRFCRDLVATVLEQLNTAAAAANQSTHPLDAEGVATCPVRSVTTSTRTTIPA